MKKVKVLFMMMALSLAALTAAAQNIAVKGTITDATDGSPVPFASVVVKGTSVWTTTQNDGTYFIESPSHGVLSVSLLGYITQEVAVEGRSVVNVQLAPEFDNLSESVVIGYGVLSNNLTAL